MSEYGVEKVPQEPDSSDEVSYTGPEQLGTDFNTVIETLKDGGYQRLDEFVDDATDAILKVEGVAESALKKKQTSAANALLGLGLSEQFNDCSIAAASACKNVYNCLGSNTQKEEFVFLGEDGAYETLRTHSLTPELSLPEDGRKITFMVGRSTSDPEAPAYLFAVTRGDLALRLASFKRRESNIVCDYVQIGREMTDENFVVTPADEHGSRLDIVEQIRHLTHTKTVDLSSLSSGRKVYVGMNNNYEDRWKNVPLLQAVDPNGNHELIYGSKKLRLATYYSLKELTKKGVINEPGLLDAWDNHPWIIDPPTNRRKRETYEALAELMVAGEIDNGLLTSFARKRDVEVFRNNWRISRIIEASRSLGNEDEGLALAVSLGVRDQLYAILGDTEPAHESLFDKDKLPKIVASGKVRGIKHDVEIGKTRTTSEFELEAEAIGKSGYRLFLRGLPADMAEHGFKPLHIIEFYKDRQPEPSAVKNAPDVLDLIANIRW